MKKIKIALVLFTSIVTSWIGLAQDAKTQVNVDFKIRNLGINVDGRFNTSSITSNFSSQDLSQWVLYGYVDVNSIDTDNKKRDKHLLEEEYFDVSTYPKIELEATNFIKTSENNYKVTVNLTIKRTTKSLVIPVEIIGDSSNFKLKSNFEINRKHFGVGGSSLILSNTVKIYVDFTLNN